jgi:hypothetical protein
MPSQTIRKVPSGLADAFRADGPTPELDEWINRLENERKADAASLSKQGRPRRLKKSSVSTLPYEAPTHQFNKRGFDIWSGDIWDIGLPPGPVGTLRTERERLAELMEILWADTKFWKQVANNAPPEAIAADIRKRYELQFPPLPPIVWQQMVRQPEKRTRLFQLLDVQFLHGADKDALRMLFEKLPPAVAGNLLWEYFFGPAQSHLDRLASFKLDRHTLAYLGKSINKLVAEVAWCERTPGVIPPPLVPHPRHRAHDVKRARDIEQMVTRLLENPALTDSEMGQEYAKKQKSEDYGTTGRKLAAEARNLAQWREGKAVERYIAKSGGRVFGRKPRRPVKSDNQK